MLSLSRISYQCFDAIGTGNNKRRLFIFSALFLVLTGSKGLYIGLLLYESQGATITVIATVLSSLMTIPFLFLLRLPSAFTVVFLFIAFAAIVAGAMMISEMANEHALIIFVAATLGLCGIRKDENVEVAITTIRWIGFVALFGAGLQKIFYGTYFWGDFIAFMTANDQRFEVFFQPLFSADDFNRLIGYRGQVDIGPFRPYSSPLIILMSNLVWIAEILFPLMLLHVKTRKIAAILSIFLVVAIQLAAREYYFCLHMVNIFFLFLPLQWHKVLAMIYIPAIFLLLYGAMI